MTEERKQELRQLLNEAMKGLEIRPRSTEKVQLRSIDVQGYKTLLERDWISKSLTISSNLMSYEPHIVNEVTKARLLDLTREEFAPFIHEDRIQSASYMIRQSGLNIGYPLGYLLEQLLKIAIVYGTERAVSDFDRCTENTHASFQYIALLEGISLETDIQIFEGIKLVPLPLSTSELQHYLPDIAMFHTPVLPLVGKTLLIIDASVSPIFHKPFPDLFREDFQEDLIPFKVQVKGGKSPKFKVEDFHNNICQALSLGCNSPVRVPLKWRFVAKNEIFNLDNLGVSGIIQRYDADPFGNVIEIGQSEIAEAKRLYEMLVKLDSDPRKKLQIAIDRWIKSKTSQTPEDKMIDLGVALESLFLPKNKTDQLSLSFRLRAAWHLGESKAHRKELIDEFDAIYTLRSEAVHNGELSPKVKIRKGNKVKQGKSILTSEFIPRAQELCRASIIKILEGRKSPDDDYWKDLILG